MNLPLLALPDVSIVIPIFNEAAILERAVKELTERLEALGWNYELVLAENGSSDGTHELAARLESASRRIRVHHTGEPNYGRALKEGIIVARAPLVVCDEIDLCDTDFHARALALLESDNAHLIVGSKVSGAACDRRPLVRRFGTLAYTTLLRVFLGFRGTDTHGPKAFRREKVLPIVDSCVVDRDVFASEFVIRASRAKLRVVELPIGVAEKRPPSINLWRRVPHVLSRLWRLRRALRSRREPTR